MDVRDAARIFHDWAITEGFIPEASASPTSTAAELALVSPTTDEVKQILRIKQVQMIGFARESHQITIFTKRATPNKKQQKILPSIIDDVAIRYRQGLQHAIGEPPASASGSGFFTRQVNQRFRYACGSSISVGNVAEAGTLGALVRDPAGTIYGLSNNHVSASCNFAPVGMPILAPGVVDVAAGSLPPFTIGFHHRASLMQLGTPSNVNHQANLDAALFRLANPDDLTSFQGSAYDTPTNVATMSPGMTVEKVGRTTGHTTGQVHTEIYGPVPITYRCAAYNFTGMVFFEPMFRLHGTGASPFSDSGDSGSLVTSLDPATGNRSAVGIIVGGGDDNSAPGGKVSFALPLGPILASLGVALVGGHNV